MTSRFEGALGAELAQAARRLPRRPRTRIVGVAAAVAAVVAVALATLISPQTALADVRVTHENGRIEVLLTDLESDSDEVEDALRAEGLDVEVEGVPTGPSNRGRFVSATASDPEVLEIDNQDNPGSAFLGFSVPEGWTGKLQIGLGRSAAPGEDYVAFSDAFAEGEPLACTAVRGETIAAAVDDLEGLDVSVQPIADETLLDLVPLDQALQSGYGEWYITVGTAFSAKTIILDATAVPPERRTESTSC